MATGSCDPVSKRAPRQHLPTTSTVSNTELNEFFGPHRVLGRELSEFLLAYYLCVRTRRVFAKFTEFAAELSEFSLSLETVFCPFLSCLISKHFCRKISAIKSYEMSLWCGSAFASGFLSRESAKDDLKGYCWGGGCYFICACKSESGRLLLIVALHSCLSQGIAKVHTFVSTHSVPTWTKIVDHFVRSIRQSIA